MIHIRKFGGIRILGRSSLEPPRTFPSPYNSSARQEMIKTMIPTINMTLTPPDPTWAIGKRTYQWSIARDRILFRGRYALLPVHSVGNSSMPSSNMWHFLSFLKNGQIPRWYECRQNPYRLGNIRSNIFPVNDCFIMVHPLQVQYRRLPCSFAGFSPAFWSRERADILGWASHSLCFPPGNPSYNQPHPHRGTTRGVQRYRVDPDHN